MVTRLVRGVIPAILLAVTLVVVALRQLRQPINLDTFFHLRIGQEFLHDWTPWDPGSLTPYATRPWLPTQWLSQIVLAWAEDVGGLRAVLWLAAAVSVVYVAVLVRACLQEAPLLVAAPLAAVTLLASLTALSARPQIVSYLLAVVTLAAWLRTARDGRLRWWLVPLTWLWVLLHGMWPVGIATSLVAAAGLTLDAPPAERRSRARAFGVGLGSALVAGLTPVGPGAYGAVLLVGSRANYFSEWAPPDFTRFPALALAGLLLLTLAVRVRSGRDTWTADLLLLTAVGWALYSNRTTPIATAMLAVLLARLLGRLRTATGTDADADMADAEGAGSPRARRMLLGGAAATILAAAGFAAVMPDPHPVEPDWLAPTAAALPDGTPILTRIEFGSYLVWAYPRLDAAFNGYADAYTTDELDDIFTLQDVGDGWQAIVRRDRFDYALLPDDDALAYNLRLAGWRVLHHSQDVEFLVRPGAPDPAAG